MLKVECEACKAPYQVDERRVPATGLKMRCPKCGHSFVVQSPQAGAAAPVPPAAAPKPPPKPAAPPAGPADFGDIPDFGDLPALVDPSAAGLPAVSGKPRPMPGKPPAVPVPVKPVAIPPAAPPVQAPLPTAAAVAAAPGPKPGPGKRQTMMGVGIQPGGLAPPPAPPVAAPTADDPFAGFDAPAPPLPAAKVVAKPPPARAHTMAQLPSAGTDEIDLPALPDGTGLPAVAQPKNAQPKKTAFGFGPPPTAAPAVPPRQPPPAAAAAPAAPAPSRANPPSLQDFDIELPVMGDLPAVKAAAPKKAPTFEIDLPSAGADLPAAKPVAAKPAARGPADLPAVVAPKRGAATAAGFGDIDAGLPVAAPKRGAPGAFGDIDAGLPVAAPKRGGATAAGFGDIDAGLPVAAAKRGGGSAAFGEIDTDLPSPAARPQSMAFGEIDLPSLGGGADLPALPNDLPSLGGVGLPAVAGAGLPAVAGVGLPAVAGIGLPAVAGIGLPATAGIGLPATAGIGLPAVAGVGLPSVGGPGLPEVAGVGLPTAAGNLPARLDDNHHMPMAIGEADFGDLNLPRSKLDDIEELDIAPDPSLPPAPKATRGGMGYGEVDLGGAGGSAELDAEAHPSLPEDGLRSDGDAAPRPRRDKKTTSVGKSSRAPRAVAFGLFGVVVAGALLHFTSYGAFGYQALGDVFHRNQYARIFDQRSAAARAKLGDDLFDTARAAVDELAAAHQVTPRVRPLTLYTAIAEYETQLRFGRDAARATRAKAWVDEVRNAAPETRYLALATGVQKGVDGDLPAARKELDAASKTDPSDPMQLDIALMRGEVELQAKDAAAAIAAFSKAAQLAPSARAQFGLARAQEMAGDLVKARAAVTAAITASPGDAGALAMRARFAWEKDKDDVAALADLKEIIEGKAKAHAAQVDVARAQALAGWIHLTRGRLAEARAAFEACSKLEPSNVSALVGLGELLYKDSRYTEALAHFDTAVQTEPANTRAIVDDAKTKIALERLADAKTQLLAAREAYPKSMQVALWLGKAEEALGTKKQAEESYIAALGLIDLKAEDAIEPYVALAELLAGEARAAEAEAKLKEAQSKLPDSAGMQRALGEVAAAQGNYDQAIAHYNDAVAKDPKDLQSRYQLGVTYRKMRSWTEAAAAFDAVFAADKDYPNLSLERGVLYEQSGHVEQALDQFTSALQKAPDDLDLQLRVGASYVMVGRAKDALPYLTKVNVKRPTSAEANHYLGRAEFMLGGANLQSADRHLKRAVELDPNHAEYHLYVAWLANESVPPDLGTAEMEIKKALALDNLLADGYWQRGALERKNLTVNDAIKDLNHALQLKPTLVDAHAELALCDEDKNDLNGAMVEWQKAIQGDENRPTWRYHYGKLLLDRGNVAAAAPHLVAAVSVAEAAAAAGQPVPGWANPAEYSVAIALQRTGKKQDAIDHFNRFLKNAPASSPDRRDALAQLQILGAPYEDR